MDEKRAGFSLPGRGPWPGVDDHLVEPEVTRAAVLASSAEEVLSQS